MILKNKTKQILTLKFAAFFIFDLHGFVVSKLIGWWLLFDIQLSYFPSSFALPGFLVCRIRKGLPSEARVVARILPQFLDDFFPPQDVMNKVIGEFLSNQQPYPQFMATVVYKVSSSTNPCK